MKNFQKRISQQLYDHKESFRRPKKNKTYSRQSFALLKNKGRNFISSESISYQIVESLVSQIHHKAEIQTQKKIRKCVSQGCHSLIFHVIQATNLKHPVINTNAKIDIQPTAVECDSFCGVDKQNCNSLAGTHRKHFDNDKNYSKLRMTNHSSNKKKCNTILSDSLSEKENNANQRSEQASVHQEGSRTNLFRIKDRSKTSEKSITMNKMIPLSGNNEGEGDEHLRDRLMKQISNKKMSITLKRVNRMSLLRESKKVDQFNYDYNGDRISLLKKIGCKASNNILKTDYKVNKERLQNKFIKSQNISKTPNHRPSNTLFCTSLGSSILGREQLDDTRANELDDLASIKHRLQSQFRRQKILARPIYVD